MRTGQKMPSIPQAFSSSQISPSSGTLPSGNTHRQNEAEQLQQLLEHYHWNITKVSQQLGVTRATVYRRMKALGLEK